MAEFFDFPGRGVPAWTEVNTGASRAYAVEGGCFVIAPTAIVSPEMSEIMCDTDTKKALLAVGGGYAQIYAPDGQMISNTLAPEEEGLVYADIDLGMISLAKGPADPAGHYSRPDVTRLVLDRRPRDAMSVLSSDSPARDATNELPEEEPDLKAV